MKYGEFDVNRRQKDLKENSILNIIYSIVGFICVVFVIIMLAKFCVWAFSNFVSFIESIPNITSINFRQDGASTSVLDSSGNEIQLLFDSYADSSYISIDDISEKAQNAFVAFYDPDFFEVGEVNLDGMFKEIYTELTNEYDEEYYITGIKHDRSIAQRLLQNQFFYIKSDTSILARLKDNVREQAWAMQLHQNVKKKSVLEMYLNTLNFGGRTVGIQDASRRYFGKDASELSASEAAVLVAVSLDGDDFNPINYPRANADTCKVVLKAMLTNGFLSESEYEDALGDNVYQKISSEANKDRTVFMDVSSSYVDATIKSIKNDLMDKNDLSQTQAYNAIFRGGLKIHTCEDSGIQEICEEVINNDTFYPKDIKYYLTYSLICNDSNGNQITYGIPDLKSFIKRTRDKKITKYFKDKDKAEKYIAEFEKNVISEGYGIKKSNVRLTKQPQSSLVLVDHHSGMVRAMIGGRNYEYTNGSTNRAMAVLRQPGTVLSIPSTFVPALDASNLTLATVEDDSKYYYPDNVGTRVENNDGKYRGLITLREAIRVSDNVVTVKCMNDITPKTGYDYLTDLGITTLESSYINEFGMEESDINTSLALGKMINGVSNLELTLAYATIANEGEYNSPVFYTKVMDGSGFVMIEKNNIKTQVLRESTAWLITDAMEDVITSGNGREAYNEDSTMAVAGQTGMNLEKTDLWFEGYTPYVTCGIWMGNDDESKLSEDDSIELMWKDVMTKVIAYLHQKSEQFKMPNNIVEKTICSKSGKLLLEDTCVDDDTNAYKRIEYFRTGTEPTEYCDIHMRYTIDKNTGELADENTPEEDRETRVYLLKDETSETLDTKYVLPSMVDIDDE
ncbi:MAG: transglycosylase domain-containing protein [Lachnospiraceae bacterium]|nr:transglycosylase domain-containing protein [Lachnospiraceae bacterium]